MENNYVRENASACCGCGMCSTVCPQKCITMTEDGKGFLYPGIDAQQCINCGLCRNVCSFNADVNKNSPISQYGVHHRDIMERQSSRSGAVFVALGNYILQKKGAIYGVAFDNELNVKHIRVTDKDGLYKMKGSKYVQSDMTNIWEALETDLREGKWVLVSGTGCQIAAVNGFVKSKSLKSDRLVTCDLICHGVPSPKVYRDYLALVENRFGSKVKSFTFRDKRFGWRPHYETFILENGHECFSQVYSNMLFYSDNTLRPSCLQCPFASVSRPGDITIGDLWGGKSLGDWIDDIGNSLVFVNTEQGSRVFEEIKANLDIKPIELDDCMQPNLMRPSKKGKYYDLFWEEYENYGLEKALIKINRETVKSLSVKDRFKRKLKKVLKPLYVMKVIGGGWPRPAP